MLQFCKLVLRALAFLIVKADTSGAGEDLVIDLNKFRNGLGK
jgi:hypothetical protein